MQFTALTVERFPSLHKKEVAKMIREKINDIKKADKRKLRRGSAKK